MGGNTIHLTLHGTTTGSTHTTDIQTEASGDFDQPVTLVPGHSYTADATFDGNSNLQPASATASTNAPGTAPESTNSSS